MRRPLLALAAALLPGPVAAHDAFGDLGPFYASLLHPLADPSQGLPVAAAAVLLARQPLATALAALGGAAGIALLALLVWGGVDLLIRRLGPVAGAVAGAWVAAVGIMAAALPA